MYGNDYLEVRFLFMHLKGCGLPHTFIMYNPRLIISAMRTYGCSAIEAIQWLGQPHENAFLFTNGNVHIPECWNTDAI